MLAGSFCVNWVLSLWMRSCTDFVGFVFCVDVGV
jgi:hypothetical protein